MAVNIQQINNKLNTRDNIKIIVNYNQKMNDNKDKL